MENVQAKILFPIYASSQSRTVTTVPPIDAIDLPFFPMKNVIEFAMLTWSVLALPSKSSRGRLMQNLEANVGGALRTYKIFLHWLINRSSIKIIFL